jgi:hypothetical protein
MQVELVDDRRPPPSVARSSQSKAHVIQPRGSDKPVTTLLTVLTLGVDVIVSCW